MKEEDTWSKEKIEDFERYFISQQNGNRQVLGFIYGMCHNKDKDYCNELSFTFRHGYCYQFACMLKETFNRGAVCLAAPNEHIIWLDTDNIAYDVNGVYITQCEYIPVSKMNWDVLSAFLHIPFHEEFGSEEKYAQWLIETASSDETVDEYFRWSPFYRDHLGLDWSKRGINSYKESKSSALDSLVGRVGVCGVTDIMGKV